MLIQECGQSPCIPAAGWVMLHVSENRGQPSEKALRESIRLGKWNGRKKPSPREVRGSRKGKFSGKKPTIFHPDLGFKVYLMLESGHSRYTPTSWLSFCAPGASATLQPVTGVDTPQNQIPGPTRDLNLVGRKDRWNVRMTTSVSARRIREMRSMSGVRLERYT